MDSERVSAGFTMLNVWDRICDPNGGELPNYAVGELYVGGAGVAMGYFHNDELTAERFPTIDGERYCNTGALANDGAEDVIDVSLRKTGNDIIISIRDMGKGFNPTVRDPELDYEFDNAAVLNKVASKIEFDRSLGMNATRIHLSV